MHQITECILFDQTSQSSSSRRFRHGHFQLFSAHALHCGARHALRVAEEALNAAMATEVLCRASFIGKEEPQSTHGRCAEAKGALLWKYFIDKYIYIYMYYWNLFHSNYVK